MPGGAARVPGGAAQVPGVACCAGLRRTTWFGATRNTWHGVSCLRRWSGPPRMRSGRSDYPWLRRDGAASGLTVRPLKAPNVRASEVSSVPSPRPRCQPRCQVLLVAPNYVEPRGLAQHATPGTESSTAWADQAHQRGVDSGQHPPPIVRFVTTAGRESPRAGVLNSPVVNMGPRCQVLLVAPTYVKPRDSAQHATPGTECASRQPSRACAVGAGLRVGARCCLLRRIT